MKSIVPELKKMFKAFNHEFFDNELLMPKFTVESNRKFAFRFDSEGDIFMVGSEAANLGIADFQALFLHEMVHVSNAQDGIADVTANQYHNKSFLELALSVGLICIRHKNQGWSITTIVYPRNVVDENSIRTPSAETIEHRKSVFFHHRLEQSILRSFRTKMKQVQNNRSSKTYFLKYVCGCPPPHNSIRSGRRPDGSHPLNIRCSDCGKLFNCVSGHVQDG